jgi:hypothetical protein
VTNLLDISTGLSQKSDGIWYSKESTDISYPADGNELSSGLEDASFWFNHRNECIDALVQRYPVRSGGALFDIGGGNGYVAKALANIVAAIGKSFMSQFCGLVRLATPKVTFFVSL